MRSGLYKSLARSTVVLICGTSAAGGWSLNVSSPSNATTSDMTPIITHILLDDTPGPDTVRDRYAENLRLIRRASVRNRNHDQSVYRNTKSVDLPLQELYGPRTDYLNNPGGNPEQAFPTFPGGQNRTSCEFSHFAYDDPILFPNKPGASHLHMFFGNTDANAYSTYNTLLNTGSGTCNGQELNRTGYWVPAMFDADGNVRIPERIVVYYKGEGLGNGKSIIYPERAAMIARPNANTVSFFNGGAQNPSDPNDLDTNKFSYVCSNQYSENGGTSSNTIPVCDGDRYQDPDPTYTVLEVNVKFQQCWNRNDPADISNWTFPRFGSWYGSDCESNATFPNLEYFVNYRVDRGETTDGWYLASDVNMQTLELDKEPGSTTHGDWWGAWNKKINQMWIDNCVNFSVPGERSGCGFGYLTNGGPDGDNPIPGPALKLRPQYTGPEKVPAETIFRELCKTTREYTKPEDAAVCNPDMSMAM